MITGGNTVAYIKTTGCKITGNVDFRFATPASVTVSSAATWGPNALNRAATWTPCCPATLSVPGGFVVLLTPGRSQQGTSGAFISNEVSAGGPGRVTAFRGEFPDPEGEVRALRGPHQPGWHCLPEKCSRGGWLISGET